MAALAVVVASCAAPPPAVVAPEGDARFLVDPRIGWTGTRTAPTDRAIDAAWRQITAGNYDAARERLASIAGNEPPAALARAAIAINRQQYAEARTIIDPILARYPTYIAAQIYRAEVDVAENQLQNAYDRYRTIVTEPGAPPIATERLNALQTRLFDQLYSAAVTANDADAVRMLREALVLNPAATAARILLAQRLVALRQYDDARHELDPVLNSTDVDRPEVQASLAEIDVGKGRYQQAINRYERLAKRDTEGRYGRRLSQIKQQFAEANMPPQFTRALDAEAIMRGDLAVLLYWKVTAVRFAQDVPPPPIAIDVGEVPQRDELIRALALGIYQVDPVTRRVSPFTTVTASSLARIASRVLLLRGAACTRGVPDDPDRILTACHVDNPAASGVDMSINGRTAAGILDQVERALR